MAIAMTRKHEAIALHPFVEILGYLRSIDVGSVSEQVPACPSSEASMSDDRTIRLVTCGILHITSNCSRETPTLGIPIYMQISFHLCQF